MTLKGMLSRPSTSTSSRKRHSTFEPSQDSPRSSKSPERGHRKIGSLQRLSLSFAPSQDGTSSFHHFLTQEPGEMSRKNSVATSGRNVYEQVTVDASSRPTTSATQDIEPPKLQSSSVPLLKATSVEKQQENEVTPRPRRFSLMKFRFASEPQLSTRYKESEPKMSSGEPPPPPKIITTAPTHHHEDDTPRKSKERFLPRTFSSFRKSMVIREDGPVQSNTLIPGSRNEEGILSAPNLTRAYTEDSRLANIREGMQSPPAYGDESNSALALPITRLSESSRSEGSSGSHKLYAQTTTRHFIETTTTIFKLPKNKKKKTKDKGMLFPVPEKLHPGSERTSSSNTNDESRKSMSPSRRSTQAIRWKSNLSRRDTPQESSNASMTALTDAPLGSPGPAVTRKQSALSTNSGNTTPTGTLVPPRLGARGRSSTMGSLGRSNERLHEQLAPSGRTSTSTTGRRSFGDILSLSHRLRRNSVTPRHGSNSGSTPGSKSNSFQISRESEPELVYPQRDEEDTPASYLEKLEAAVPRGAMATILCKSPDEFSRTCLRKYMRGFSYFGESIDISIRKMLMEVVLPKETQQIDRLLAGFADRYHECNPGIFMNADEANFIAFSILLLQSDNHNKNNKRKMTKQDYAKNTQNGRISVAEDVLDSFYDNICYTPFIHFDDEIAINNHRLHAPKRKGLIRTKSSEMLRGPIDPYTLILENKLEVLRPSLKDVIETEDPYSSAPVNTNENHKAFVHAAVLQIVSARSRPDAFTNQATITNPAEAQAGLVSIKVAKVGLLWRKSTKKKKAKSPWQEWGVILTDSKLYFFKDIGWVRKLINQYENHPKTSTRSQPLVFKPPLSSFEPDAWMAMDDAVALVDSTYKRHKNAFTFIKHLGFEEVFLANSDPDVVDWVSKLNYAATFRTAGVRMRGLLGNNYEGRHIYRKDSEVSNKTNDMCQNEQPTPITGKTNPQLSWEIMFYRRQLVSEKISTFDDHVAAAQKELDYLLRNARHLLILLPIQQKTREGIVFAAGRMNAKLKWTRKEIWRSKTHRDVLIKDLEAEATTAFPASAAVPSRGSTNMGTPMKTTPTKAGANGLLRSDTDQTVRSNMTKSPAAATPSSTVAGRRPSQAVLEQIQTDTSEPLDIAGPRRRSAASQIPSLPKQDHSPGLGDDQFSQRVRTPSLHTQTSQHMSVTSDPPTHQDDNEERLLQEAGLLAADGTPDRPTRHGSASSKEQSSHTHFPSLGHLHESNSNSNTLKDRAGSVRRSLHRTLRDSSGGMHMPHHSRSRRGKDSGSSFGANTEDGRSVMSGESEELKRDPTGRFVLHGKKASVITMPEWQLSAEERLRLREQMLREAAATEGTEPERATLHIDTDMIDAGRKSVDAPSIVTDGDGDLSPGAPPSRLSEHAIENNHTAHDGQRDTNYQDDFHDKKRMTMDSMKSNFSVYSAVTSAPTPVERSSGERETFHSAENSPRQSTDSGSDEEDEDEAIFLEDSDAITVPHDELAAEVDRNDKGKTKELVP